MKHIEHEITTLDGINVNALSTEEQRTLYAMLLARVLELYRQQKEKETEVNEN